jgi:hypothetical protein
MTYGTAGTYQNSSISANPYYGDKVNGKEEKNSVCKTGKKQPRGQANLQNINQNTTIL